MPLRSAKTKFDRAFVPRHSSRTRSAPAAANILSSRAAAESCAETPSPTPSRDPRTTRVQPAPGSAAKPPQQADLISTGFENNSPPLPPTTPTRLLKYAPVFAATSSENTSKPADSRRAQRPSDSPHS